MRKFNYILLSVFLSTFMLLNALAKQPGQPAPLGLLCDLLPGKQVITNNNKPFFSWIIPQGKYEGISQTAYQIIVSSNKKGNIVIIWDSGKVNSNQSSSVAYAGPSLAPNQTYYWKVRVWNNKGLISVFSASQQFVISAEAAGYATASQQLIKSVQYPSRLQQGEKGIFADFAKDAFSQLRLQLTGSNSADSIIIRLGEQLEDNGEINRKPGGAIRYSRYSLFLKTGTHWYDLKIRSDARNTGPAAIKMPQTIGEVTPFRYLEIENYRSKITPAQIERLMVHYPFNDEAATFTSSDTILNHVWDLCKYSIKATSFAGIYVDGDRERSPYEADALINQLSHYVVDREYTLARKSHEYLIRKGRWPTEWILQSIIIAWNDYLYTGDSRSLKNYYTDLKNKTLLALQDSTGLISTFNQTDSIRKSVHYSGKELRDIVDWPRAGGTGLSKNARDESDGFVFKRYNAVTNAYFYNGLVLIAKIAEVLKQDQDIAFFKAKAAKFRQDYQKAFWNPKNGTVRDGIGTEHSALHSNLFALDFGLIDTKNIPAITKFMKSRGMACSVYGSQFLLDAFYDAGESDYGLSLLTDTSIRSWYNMIKKGSTITMEAWDNVFKPNQDWNHAWGAAPANIISRKLMGVEPLAPAWSQFAVKPQSGKLTSAKITVPTIKGEIKVHFERSDGLWFKMNVTVPANTVAVVTLPGSSGKTAKLTIDGVKANYQQVNGAIVVNNVTPGNHVFNLSYL